MGAVAVPTAGRRLATIRGRLDVPAVAAWALPFATVGYLALDRGGYDPLVRGQVGIALWWIVLVGAAVGVLPAAPMSRAAWVGLGLLSAFAVWTGLSLTWTESEERTAAEVAKLSGYVALLTLMLASAGRTSARHTLNGLACAVGLVALMAVLSRLQPGLFPEDDLPSFFGENSARRLSYPLNYWNGLAAFAAMGLPLLLRAATDARTLVMRAVAAAAVPLVALCVFLTASRGGAIYVGVALALWIALSPRRLPRLATLLATVAGSAIVIAGADQRDALQSGLGGAAAATEGDALLAMLIVVCAGIAFVQVAIALVTRYARPPRWAEVPRGQARTLTAVATLGAVCVAVAAGLPSTIDTEWQQFKQLDVSEVQRQEDAFARLESASGNGRYQYWQQAAEAQSGDPLGGIGAGTFEFWWARNATHSGGFIRDAHSLYMETFAELGLVGLLLVAGFLALAIGVGVRRCFLRLPVEHRAAMAAATAGLAAFATAAAFEWIWDLPAIAAAALVLAAVPLAAGRRARAYDGGAPIGRRALLVIVAVVGTIAIALPVAGTASLRASEERVRDGDLAAALDKARQARDVQPYSASARLQEALVLERAGDVEAGVAAARAAAEQERTNWRTWLVLSRLEAKAGSPQASLVAYRRARALNPRSPLFR